MVESDTVEIKLFKRRAWETKEEKKKDAHSLVSIKPGFTGRKASETEQHTEILPKSVEESKEA